MPTQRIRVSQTLYYDVFIEADSEEEAKSLLRNPDIIDDLDIYEVDSTEMEVCDD